MPKADGVNALEACMQVHCHSGIPARTFGCTSDTKVQICINMQIYMYIMMRPYMALHFGCKKKILDQALFSFNNDDINMTIGLQVYL